MSQKCQAIVIGIGPIGEQVVDQFLADYGKYRGMGLENTVPEQIAIISHREGGRVHDPIDGCRFFSHDEQSLLENIARAFDYLLGDRPVSAFGFSYYLDVYLCGAWMDGDFRFHLPLVLTFLERLGHERYGSIFNSREDRRNARLLVHPLALSINMPREPSRDEISPLLARIAHWHDELTAEGREIVPRFFVYDGFTNNIQLNHREIVDITANFVGMCTRSGVRADADFRGMLNFAPYAEDFFSVLSLATIQFARNKFRKIAVDMILDKLFEILLEKPELKGDDPNTNPLLASKIAYMVNSEIMGSALLPRKPAKDHYRKLILNQMFEFEGKPDTNRPLVERGIVELYQNRVTFPTDCYRYPPEALERFFDRNWLDHLFECCYPEKGRGVAIGLSETALGVRRAWYDELEKICKLVDDNLRGLLGPGQANYSLNTFCAALQLCRSEIVEPARAELLVKADELPAPRWRFSAVRDIWARMRGQIWNFIPIYAIKFWLPLLAVLSSVQLLAIYRFALTRLDPDTEGARLLALVNQHPMFLPALIVVSLIVSLPAMLVVYLLRRHRLKRYLNTDAVSGVPEMVPELGEDGPELVESGDFHGVMPSAGGLMARKAGTWWNKHENLGAIGLVQGMLKVVEMRVDALNKKAELVLVRLNEIRDRRMDSTLALSQGGLYFNDDLLVPEVVGDFARHVNKNFSIKISAQNIAGRLHDRGVGEFLDCVVDEEVVLEEILQEIPFFANGSVFLVPGFESEVVKRLKSFVRVLPDRLSHGQIFHFLASEEEDKLIENTEILLVAPQEAQGALDRIGPEAAVVARRVISRDPDHVWGLRLIRDINIESMIRYMRSDLDKDGVRALIAVWVGIEPSSPEEKQPWTELRAKT